MAFAFNPFSGKLDDVGTGGGASTAAANTWTQNQTFGGTANTAPSQTAASGSSLMTRDLVDARSWNLARSGRLDFPMSQAVGTGGGTSNASRGYWQLFTGTSAGSLAQSFFDFGALAYNGPMDFSKRVIIGFTLANAIRAGLQFYCQLGRPTPTSTGARISSRGIGIGITSAGVTPFVHNGTTLTSGSTYAVKNKYLLDWNPSVSSFDLYGAAVASDYTLLGSVTTGLPSGFSSAGVAQLEFLVYDTGSGGGDNWLYLSNAFFVTP